MYLDPIQNSITSAARIADWYFSNIALGEASKLTLSLLAPTNWDSIVYSVTVTIPMAFADVSSPSC
jgi:ribosomal protein S2